MHAALLTRGLDRVAADRFWRTLAAHQRYLTRAWPLAGDGLPRLRALAGLVWTGVVLPHAGHAAALAEMAALSEALVDAEGGTPSRSPEDLAEILILLIWTARLLEDADQHAMGPHLQAIVRAVPAMRPLRLGDGGMARFHGGGAGSAGRLDQALAELRLVTQPKPKLPMGFARLSGGRVALMMDGAAPPQGEMATRAHAGTLAFEMSVGRQRLVVNAGPGQIFGGDWALVGRQTAAHSTVEVDGRSSARIEATGLAARTFGARLVDGPAVVSVRQAQDATGQWLLATQDGYVASHGLLQERRLFVDARGQELRGEEILTVADARARTQFERRATAGRLGFAARFHLHPAVKAELDAGRQLVTLTLPLGRGVDVPRRRRRRWSWRSRSTSTRPRRRRCRRRRWLSAPRWSSISARSPGRSAASPRPLRTEPLRSSMSPDLVPIRRALISVSDKAGLVELAGTLAARGIELVSTGGTAQALRAAGLPVRDVAALTDFPEMLDGRVKTLHPMVHAGLLAVRDDPEHQAALEAYGIATIDLLVVNLYPFEATVAAGGDYAACVENIDIGGPAMLRAAAKNHAFVTVVTDVEDYAALLAELERNGGATSLAFRRAQALTAYGRTAAYDAAVSGWLAGRAGRAGAASAELRRHAGPAAALRREPAPGGGLLSRRQRAAGGRHRAAAAGQGAELQQHQRHRRRLRAGGGVPGRRRAGGGDHQARQSLRGGAGRDPPRGLPRRLRLRPDLGLRRHRGAERDARRRDGGGDRRDLHRGGDRAGGDRSGRGGLRGEEEPAAAGHRRAARSGGAGARLAAGGRRLPGAGARQRPAGAAGICGS